MSESCYWQAQTSSYDSLVSKIGSKLGTLKNLSLEPTIIGKGVLLELNAYQEFSSGSPDGLALEDLNPCLTPYTKKKPKVLTF